MLKKICITICIAIVVIFLSIIAAGMYKFNYLSGKPGYDVDGNKISIQ